MRIIFAGARAVTEQFAPDGETLFRFLASPARTRMIQGPRGSGKSSTCCFALLMNAQAQRPMKDGVRRTRFYVVRNTYDELNRTTLATWKRMFPEERFGRVTGTRPMVHHIRRGDVDCEVTFLALDDPEDVKKLKSTDITGVYFNEFGEIAREIIDAADTIIGRYPSKGMVEGGCTRPMVIADTNPAPETHWWSMMSGQVPVPQSMGEEDRQRVTRPRTWELFIQPPGLLEERDAKGQVIGYAPNPKAENLRWLPDRYYENMVEGKDRVFILVNILNRPGTTRSGKPVWPMFRRLAHVAEHELEPVAGHPLLIGVDFGRTPAAIIGQRPFDRWRILDELAAQQMGAKEFARVLRNHLGERFPNMAAQIWGDPAGEHLAEADDISPFLMFRSAGLRILPAPTNDPTIRINTVAEALGQLVDGAPRVRISPRCIYLIAAAEGGYQYAKMKVSGTDRYSESPRKDEHSHVADAWQYLMIGAGEGRALITAPRWQPDAAAMGHPGYTSAAVGKVFQARGPGGSIFDRRRGGARR